MPAEFSRRDSLKFAALITLAAHGGGLSTAYAALSSPVGYGTDPNLLRRVVTWPKSLDSAQRATLKILCDIVLPEEPSYPSAAALQVHEFLDEWLSAPYPKMRVDRELILGGLSVLDQSARRELGVLFMRASSQQQQALFDGYCRAEPTQNSARRLIELVCGGYYTTREGAAAMGYLGNTALLSFPGPPIEVIHHLEQALEGL